MAHTTQMLVTTEWFGTTGWMQHECRVVCDKRQTVASVVNDLCQSEVWSPSELAYGVIIADDEVADDEWPEHAPSGLRWVVNKPYRVGMTMQELFAGVHKKENERYFLVYSKLDVKTKHIGEGYEEVVRTNVEQAVGWLSGLYIDVNGMLRQLKSHAE